MFNIVAIFSRSRTKRALPSHDPLLQSANLSQSQRARWREHGLRNRLWKIISKCSVYTMESWSKMGKTNGKAPTKKGVNNGALNEDLPNFFVNALFIFALLLNVHISFGLACSREKRKINRIWTKTEDNLLRETAVEVSGKVKRGKKNGQKCYGWSRFSLFIEIHKTEEEWKTQHLLTIFRLSAAKPICLLLLALQFTLVTIIFYSSGLSCTLRWGLSRLIRNRCC